MNIHELQAAAAAWLGARDPLTVDVVMGIAMTLEGMGIPGIPGEIPMLAQVGIIEAGHTTYLRAAGLGTIANFAGSLIGYWVAKHHLGWLPARWLHHLEEGGKKLSGSQHAGWLIALSRSIGALRTPITWAAGRAGYPLIPYAIWSLVGAALHVFGWQYLLWKGASALLKASADDIERYGPAVALMVLGAGGVALLWKRWQKMPERDPLARRPLGRRGWVMRRHDDEHPQASLQRELREMELELEQEKQTTGETTENQKREIDDSASDD